MKNYELIEELMRYPAGCDVMVEIERDYDKAGEIHTSVRRVVTSEINAICDDDGNEIEKSIFLFLTEDEKQEVFNRKMVGEDDKWMNQYYGVGLRLPTKDDK